MNLFNKIFSAKSKSKVSKEEFANQFYIEKSDALDRVFGNSADRVGHAMISFSAGGAVDMYYYPNYMAGTGFATQELIDEFGNGPIPNCLGTYELVAFTKQEFELITMGKGEFGKIERHVCGILTGIGNYSFQAALEPYDTCQLPNKDGDNLCLIFDEFVSEKEKFIIQGNEFGLLLVIEVFRSEMEFARENGTQNLINLLREKGHYPYSDLDREPVV